MTAYSIFLLRILLSKLAYVPGFTILWLFVILLMHNKHILHVEHLFTVTTLKLFSLPTAPWCKPQNLHLSVF